MKYFTEHTGYAGATDCLATIGGQLFPSRRRDGVSTIVKGKECYSFWDANSKSYAKCKLLAEEMNFPHEHFTPGRVAKFILEEVVGVDPKLGTPDRRFIQLARDGFHWHYQHVIPGYHPYLMEFDLCAAYMTSLVKYESLYFSMNQKTKMETRSIENLRAVLPSVPKWIRLIMLGQMAAHRMTFATMPNRLSGDYSLKYQTINKISYGYAFNRAHQAILRVYRVLQRVHSIGGLSIARCHTDSFAMSPEIDAQAESEIFNYLDDEGFSYSVKAQGSAHFFDLNSGIIGRKFVGVPFEIREQLKALPEKPRRVHLTTEQLERWGCRGVLPDRRGVDVGIATAAPVQLELGIEVNERPGETDSRFA